MIAVAFRRMVAVVCMVVWLMPAMAWTAAPAADQPPSLAVREQQLLQQFRDLERSFLRLADLLAGSDPRRATLLRSVFAQAREAEVGDRLDTIVALLEKNQLLKAGSGQSDAIDRMKELLALLEAGDADKSLASTKEEVRQFIARVSKLIAKQRGLEGATESGSDGEERLAARQEMLAEETRDLAGDIGGFAKRLEPPQPGGQEQGDGGKEGQGKEGQGQEGQGQEGQGQEGQGQEGQGQEGQGQEGQGQEGQGQEGQGQEGQGQEGQGQEGQGQEGQQGQGQQSGSSPEQQEADDGDDEASRARRTRSRLQAAEQRMREAQERLDDANRRDARAEQERALEELETARAELEEILRQMREEEVERLLVQLETRIRSMLRAEKGVLSGTEKLADGDQAGRERQLEAARLGREQTKIAGEATKALTLVRDDGSAVAIPQALEQIRDDSLQAAARLTRGDVGGTTRGVIQDIVTGLEELLAALEQAQREQQEQQQNPAGGRPAEPGEQPLVDKLAELKMIRSLQMRVNTRTQRFSQLLDEGVEQADEPELLDALERLAERQRSIQQAAHDIVSGRTE
jgi:hypothetical protein